MRRSHSERSRPYIGEHQPRRALSVGDEVLKLVGRTGFKLTDGAQAERVGTVKGETTTGVVVDVRLDDLWISRGTQAIDKIVVAAPETSNLSSASSLSLVS